jgi:hypothetical protein
MTDRHRGCTGSAGFNEKKGRAERRDKAAARIYRSEEPSMEQSRDRTKEAPSDIAASEERRPQSGDEHRERVARRAYERFQARGGEHGHDQKDWLEAERELSARGE